LAGETAFIDGCGNAWDGANDDDSNSQAEIEAN